MNWQQANRQQGNWRRWWLLLVVVASVGWTSFATEALGYDKLSPFEGLRWSETWTPEVQVNDTWYTLLAIGDLTAEDIVSFCRKTWPDRAKKRFGEDLVEVLSKMGWEPGKSVDLRVRPIAGGKATILRGVAMTRDKREAIRRGSAPGRPAPRPKSEPLPKISRKHSKKVPKAWKYLVTRPNEKLGRKSEWLTAEQARADLDALEAYLVDRHSYLELKKVDYEKALDAVRASLGKRILKDDLGIQLNKVIALLGDGHARVRGSMRMLPPGFLPFSVGDAGGRVVAWTESNEFVVPGHPYVQAIDGKPIEEWLEVAGRIDTQGAPQLMRARALERLPFIEYVRSEMGLPAGKKLSVVFRSAESDAVVTKTFGIADRPVFAPRVRGAEHEMLADQVGYLRISEMNSAAAAAIPRAMEALKDSRGLIIDVRGNGGGSRQALRVLFPYFMKPDAKPYVANIAAYRLSKAFRPDRLEARFMYAAQSGQWSKPERAAVKKAAKKFRPSWKLPKKKFSAWHYFVLSRSDAAKTPFYPHPVVVLLDSHGFSATDIFVGAFKGWPRVTLMGLPSGGGSGRQCQVDLPSGFEVRLSSMASYLPNGGLYDGVGIEPDVRVERVPSDLLGKTDTQLERAQAWILEKRAADK